LPQVQYFAIEGESWARVGGGRKKKAFKAARRLKYHGRFAFRRLCPDAGAFRMRAGKQNKNKPATSTQITSAEAFVSFKSGLSAAAGRSLLESSFASGIWWEAALGGS